MGLDELPEVKLARRIIRKHALEIPFDLEALIQQYAKLVYTKIDIEGVDGVSINLKTPGKKPIVLVEESLSPARKKFTLAHELGHLVIPWHVGTIGDETYTQHLKNLHYAQLEQEANRFAAALLMPQDWILAAYHAHHDHLGKLFERIVATAGVSHQAAAIRMIQILPPNILFILERNGMVMNVGKTAQTSVILPVVGDAFSQPSFPYVECYEAVSHRPHTYHWYALRTKIAIDITNEQRPWRTILDDILISAFSKQEALKTRMSINGIIESAHDRLRTRRDYCADVLISEAIYRLNRKGLEPVVAHPDFEKFVKLRAQDFFE